MLKKVELKPIPFELSNRLIERLNEVLKEERITIKDKLDDFYRTHAVPKRGLIEYFIVANTNSLCYPSLTKNDLPEWLVNFLWACFDRVQKELSSNNILFKIFFCLCNYIFYNSFYFRAWY